MNKSKWTSTAFISATIPDPRPGIIGWIKDLIIGPRMKANPAPYAGCFVALSENGEIAVSTNGTEWSLRGVSEKTDSL